jgi:hypothetical protein
LWAFFPIFSLGGILIVQIPDLKAANSSFPWLNRNTGRRNSSKTNKADITHFRDTGRFTKSTSAGKSVPL